MKIFGLARAGSAQLHCSTAVSFVACHALIEQGL